MKRTVYLLAALLLLVLAACQPAPVEGPSAAEAEAVAEAESGDASAVEFSRFFGECEDEYGDITDLEDTANFTGECSIIQIMTNAYNEQNPDNPVSTTVTDWPGFTELNTRLAANDPPDIAILHGIRIPNYASRGLLAPVGPVLETYGIDVDNFTDAAREYVSYEGELYGIPLDLHGHLYFINLDLWEQAGMVGDDGVPMIPTNWTEWQAAAEQFFEATGVPMFEQPAGGASWSRDWMALVYQQGGSIENADGLPTIDTAEGAAAINLIIDMYNGTFASEDGASNTGEAFSSGEVGSHRNGTWTVNYFDAQAADPDIPLNRFYVTSFPQFFDQPATWSSTHAYIIPLGTDADADQIDRIMKFLSWMNENNGVWAYTGHFPVNNSDIESEAFTAIPHRMEYGNFSAEAIPMPRYSWVTAFEDIMNEEIQAAVLGDKSVEQALVDAQARFDDFVDFGQ
ncbi:MAG: extracellular solute-binding protein [Chloroflexota bacterium]